MKKRSYLLSEIIAVAVVFAVIFGVPAAAVAYHKVHRAEHYAGEIVSIIARNDNLAGIPGHWIIQRDEVWDFQATPVSNDFEVKQGHELTLLLTAADTVHGFSLAGYDIEAVINPGKVTPITFVPDKVGEFRFECTSFCGEGHDDMHGNLIVVPADTLAALR